MTEYTRENMPEGLKLAAQYEWPKDAYFVAVYNGMEVDFVDDCDRPPMCDHEYSREEHAAARQALGLDKQFCNYPDCKCPIDKTTVCAMGLPTEAEEEAWREKEKQHLGSMATMRGPDHCRKQLRYQNANGQDWIDEFARTSTVDEFRGAMKFTIGKYNRRAGKKDELIREIEKMRDYCDRWISYEESLK